MINQQQIKNLRERLTAAENKHYQAARKEQRRTKEPDHIRKARRLVRKYDAVRYKAESDVTDRIRAAASKARSAILFYDADAALAAVEQFEKSNPVK